MAQWNQTEKTLRTKIVYWGPALGGKTTNLQQIHGRTDPDNENKLISLNTSSDRTLFFDLLPLELGRVLGHSLKIQLYTVPGQVRYDATRRVVLAGTDAVVFIADSQSGRGAENRAAWENLRSNLKVHGQDLASFPVIVQYNKQDVEGCLSPKEVEACLQSGRAGIVASALQGIGVMETFRAAVLEMLKRIVDLSGRRRAEDLPAIEEQITRAFEQYMLNPRAPSLAGPSGSEGDHGQGSTPPSPSTIRFSEDGAGEDLLARSLRATLGIAEQYGEMREIKNRLARRIGELEGLQALARELSKRHDVPSILAGVADAALSVPGSGAASVLRRTEASVPLQEEVVHGLGHDPLLADGDGSRAAELLRLTEPTLLESVPAPAGPAEPGREALVAAMAVPLTPALRPHGFLVVYGRAAFGPDDLRFLGLLVSHAAVCLDNAVMTEQLRRYNDQLEADVKARTLELRTANDELRELDHMKDRFLSSVSHEMRTPLTGIAAGVELLSTIIAKEHESHEFLLMIQYETHRLSALVDRILRFQVLGRTAAEERPQPFDAQSLIASLVRELEERAAPREVTIRLDLPERPPALAGDVEGISLALREILDNAIRHSPRGEAVHVEGREKIVHSPMGEGRSTSEPSRGSSAASEAKGGRFFVITVRDKGPGIPLEDQTRIFERFEQVGDLLTAKPDGLGLGLAIAREIARRHGGDLRVRSEAGAGSEFRLYLPVLVPARSPETSGVLETVR